MQREEETQVICRWCYQGTLLTTIKGKTHLVRCSKDCGYKANLTNDDLEFLLVMQG